MKKGLFFIVATILLVGGCSMETEVSKDKTESQVSLVQQTNNKSNEDVSKEKVKEEKKTEEAEKAKKAEEAKKIEEAEKAKKAEEAKKIEEAEKAKKAEEAKKVEEAEKAKKAEEAKKIEEAEKSVQTLEANQVTENVAPAQAAVEQVSDPTAKANFVHRIELVQNAINVRAQQAADAAQQQADAQEQRTVYVAQYGKSSAYWYNIDNMPSNPRKDKVITMSEADAIRAGKHHSNKE